MKNQSILRNLVVVLILLTHNLGVRAQCSSNDIEIKVIAAPNLITDSNIETPAGVSVTAAFFGATFKNVTTDTLVNVYVYIGDHTGSGSGTPGIYPSRTHSGLSGTFAFEHAANTQDATRIIDTLLPKESVTMYWMANYPNLDSTGNAVYGHCADETDDLYLNYDFWTTFSDDEFPGTTCFNDTTLKATIRCEITASANKIWPNGDNKVPDEWVEAVEESLGYSLGWDLVDDVIPGVGTSAGGVWYDFGKVNQGFDNDGDLVSDYNAWMQPVGNSAIFNANCFRLVKTSGVLLINTNSQGLVVRAFEDQLYFQNLPEDNTGVVGYVVYEFVSLLGPCASLMTPYQEVASGRNNEKFNADYGTGVLLNTILPTASIEKSVDSSFIDLNSGPDTVSYNLSVSNDGVLDLGSPSENVPLVISDTIPTGCSYLSGTASSSSGAYTFDVFYSSNNGQTWSKTEPSPASSVTDIQWWFQESFEGGTSASVSFSIIIPDTYPAMYSAVITNTAGIGLGGADPFDNDDAYTFVRAESLIGDTVFVDDGSGGGIEGDGIQNGSEGPISGVDVYLVYDVDGDGVFDDNDIVMDTATTDANGKYQFSGLPAADYIVIVETMDVIGNPSYPGYSLTTKSQFDITLGNSDTVLTFDFGFAPALRMTKTLISNDTLAESDSVQFDILVKNIAHDPGTLENPQTFWMINLDDGATWTGSSNAIGSRGPNGTYALSPWSNGLSSFDPIHTSGGVDSFSGSITKVELIDQFYLSGALSNDTVRFSAYTAGTEYGYNYSAGTLNSYVGSGNVGSFVTDITSLKTSWNWAEIDSIQRRISATKEQGSDGADMYLDAMGVRITTEGGTGSTTDALRINVPLYDSFDVNEFSYLGASPTPGSVDRVNGVIYWENLGPISAGGEQTISIYMKALEPTANYDNFANNASIRNAEFLNGVSANDVDDSDTVSVVQRGTIAGTIWSDQCGSAAGSYNAGVDGLLGRVPVVLFGCFSTVTDSILYPAPDPTKVCTSTSGGQKNNGEWRVIDTVLTNDSLGTYLFEGLQAGYYYSQVITSGLSTPSQVADPDATTDNQWGATGTVLNSLDDLITNEDKTGLDFGYTVDPSISGYVFEHIGSDSIPLEGVILTTSGPVTDTTDISGYYELTGLSTGTYTVTVTTPAGATWTQVYAPTSPTLCAGQVLIEQNYAYTRTGSSTIGDTLFFDIDGDGVRDAIEEGIPSTTVYLIRDVDGDGAYTPGIDIYQDTTTTNANGYYLFSGLPANDFIISVSTSTLPDMVLSLTADPDEPGVCTVCNSRASVTTDGTTSVDTIDFGYVPSGSAQIGDLVWIDSDNDTIKSALENGIDSITIYLYADYNDDGTYVLIDSTETDASGNYTFDDLPNGDYRINYDVDDPQFPSGLVNTNYTQFDLTVNGDTVNNTTLSCTNCALTADFAFNNQASIGDMIYWDANGSGSFDQTEIGIANVRVYLLDSLGVAVDSTLTSDGTGSTAAGYYEFENLLPGDYTVVVADSSSALGGAAQTADPNSDGLACSDPLMTTYGYPACDNAYGTDLYYGDAIGVADFGYEPSGTFGDYVWYDLDGDSTQDAGEQPMADISIYRCTSSAPCSPSSGDFLDSVVTDNDGFYFFTNIPDGTYSLTVNPPQDYVMTNNNLDSTVTVTLSSGDVSAIDGSACSNCNLDVDFGMRLTGTNSLAGNICLDDGSNDGVCSGTSGEVDIDSVIVYLYRKVGTTYEAFGTTLTASDGSYSFGNLPNDTFIVSIGKTNPFISISTLTTEDADAPSGDIVETAFSVYHRDIILTGGATQNNVDFAFELPNLDFGDLPSGYEVVSFEDNGAMHVVNSNWYLGALIDAEADGVESRLADGDDNAASDDEDGISFVNSGTWYEGSTQCVSITYSIPADEIGYVVGWIDWNHDSSFLGDVVVDTALESGGSPVTACFTVPNTVNLDSTNLNTRFRLFAENQALAEFAYNNMPGGDSLQGEVEDYSVSLMSQAPLHDYGDLPVDYGTAWNTYNDSNRNNVPDQSGAVWLGQYVTHEIKQPYTADASGDVVGDDGFIIPSTLDTFLGATDTFKIIVNANVASTVVYFKVWFDWDGDQVFDSIYTGSGVASSPDTVDLIIHVPNTYQGNFFARVRASSSPAEIASVSGEATNGETEDYLGTPTPLPVDWLYFKAKKLTNTQVNLTWATAMEDNNERFDIYRKKENEDRFIKINEVPGIGFSNEIEEYQYLDILEPNTHGYVYYKLQQVDFDGKSSETPTRVVYFGGPGVGLVGLYPNPTAGDVTISGLNFSAPGHDYRYLIFDISGRIVRSGEFGNNGKINVRELESGSYMINIVSENGDEEFGLPFIKLRQ